MDVEIQAYWGAKLYVASKPSQFTAEETLKCVPGRKIVICAITIDKKFVGNVEWDGKKLTVVPPRKG
jgi:hypothetical protein